jgi:hypothetical protein
MACGEGAGHCGGMAPTRVLRGCGAARTREWREGRGHREDGGGGGGRGGSNLWAALTSAEIWGGNMKGADADGRGRGRGRGRGGGERGHDPRWTPLLYS